jgi:hypothetical protein
VHVPDRDFPASSFGLNKDVEQALCSRVFESISASLLADLLLCWISPPRRSALFPSTASTPALVGRLQLAWGFGVLFFSSSSLRCLTKLLKSLFRQRLQALLVNSYFLFSLLLESSRLHLSPVQSPAQTHHCSHLRTVFELHLSFIQSILFPLRHLLPSLHLPRFTPRLACPSTNHIIGLNAAY